MIFICTTLMMVFQLKSQASYIKDQKELKKYETTGTVIIKVDKGEYRYTVYLQPGVLYKGVYVWFYKPNKRAAAKIFREQLIDDIRHCQDKINRIWDVYDVLENYVH